MATSGSVDWTVTRDEIIKAAYRLVLVDEDFSPTTNQTTNAALLLNAIVKSYNATLGMPLWAMRTGFLLPFTTSYSTNSTSGYLCGSYVNPTISTAGVATDTTIEVSSATGIGNGYYIGIELDSGDMQWTTVNGVPVGTTITLTDALTGAAAVGNNVYCFQTRLERPLRVIDAWTIVGTQTTSQSDVPVRIVTPEEFLEISNKTTEQYPLYLNYEPLIGFGNFKIWPRFSNGERVVAFRYHRALEDFDAANDNPDFPVEWNLPLIYELAIALAPTYNMDVNKLAVLRAERTKWVTEVADNDYEEGSLHFSPAMSPFRM